MHCLINITAAIWSLAHGSIDSIARFHPPFLVSWSRGVDAELLVGGNGRLALVFSLILPPTPAREAANEAVSPSFAEKVFPIEPSSFSLFSPFSPPGAGMNTMAWRAEIN